jgi:hypothetical protein
MPGARVAEGIPHQPQVIDNRDNAQGVVRGMARTALNIGAWFCLLLFPSAEDYGFKFSTGCPTASKAGQK